MSQPLTRLRTACALGAVVLGISVPGASAQIPGGDSITSDNVEHVANFRDPGDGVGARIIGNTMFVTSTTGLFIYDITDAENPQRLGTFTADVEFENEDVPTNGKILGISASTFGVNCPASTLVVGGCLNLYDVTDPSSPTLITSVIGAGAHTSECVLDCTWFYGSEGQITNATDVKNAKLSEVKWTDKVEEQTAALGIDDAFVENPHAIREFAPGLLLTSSMPAYLLSVRPEHGGAPENPKIIAYAAKENANLFHSAEWANNGRDKFAIIGEETVLNAQQCSDQSAAIMVWDASPVLTPDFYKPNSQFKLTDEWRPVNGTAIDGYSPYSAFGCSVHWFDLHPTWKNGGLFAVSAYENGTRLFQVTPEGKLVQQGFALPLGGAASAPYWHPGGKHFYTVDYQRGFDIWRYTGETYVPAGDGSVPGTPGATPGTGGKGPEGQASDAPPCASAAGFREAKAVPQGARVQFQVDRREAQPFTVDVFQQSQGRTVVRERLVARFTNQSGTFTWNGTDRKRRKLKDGNYFVRFTMKTAAGQRDTRRATLTRTRGRFRNAPDFYQRIDCGIFSSLKLTSSVFGGRSNSALGIAYKLNTAVSSVKIQVKVGSRTVRRYTGKGIAGRTYRFSLPARLVRRNKNVSVVVTPVRQGQGGDGTPVTLVAKRI